MNFADANTGLNSILNDGNNDDRDGVPDTAAMPDADERFESSPRIEVAAHNSASGRAVWAVMFSTQNAPPAGARIMSLHRSTNLHTGAPTWTQTPIPASVDLFPGGQGFNHGAIVAHPTEADVVFISGDRGGNSAGNVWRVDLSPAAGAPIWQSVVLADADEDGARAPTSPHADSRDMVFNAVGQLLQATDGGIYRLNSPNDNTRYWESMNNNLRATEVWSAAYDATSGTIIAGLQDNGIANQRKQATPSFTWDGLPIGDGMMVQAVNGRRYWAAQNFQGFQHRAYDANGNPTGATTTPALSIVGTATPHTLTGPGIMGALNQFDSTREFFTRYAVNKFNPQQIMVGSSFLYESFDGGATLVPVTGLNVAKTAPANPIGGVSAIAYGHANNQDIAYVGSVGSKFFVRTAITDTVASPRTSPTFADFSPRPVYSAPANNGGNVLDIAIDPFFETGGYVVDNRGQVFAFENTGMNAGDWKRINGTNKKTSLSRLSTELYSIEAIQHVRAPEGIIIVVAGHGGVFATLNPSAGDGAEWFRVGDKLPRTIAYDVRYHAAASPNDVLTVATMGRGVWSITGFIDKLLPPPATARASLSPPPSGALGALDAVLPPDFGVLEIVGDELANKNDIFRIVLDPADSDLLNIFVNNTSEEPDFSVDASAVQKVVVIGGEGDDTLVIDHANGLVTFRQDIEFDQTGPGNNNRQDINLTPMSAGMIARIRDGLAGLALLGSRIAEFGQAAQKLPGIGTSLAETFAIGDGSDPIGGALQQGLVDQVSDYFDGDLTPTVEELVDRIRSLSTSLGGVSFGIDPNMIYGTLEDLSNGSQELRFDLSLQLGGFRKDLSLDFGTALDSLGLSFSADGAVDITTNLNLAFSFGVDLSPGLSDTEAFFIRVEDLSLQARLSAGERILKSPIVYDFAEASTGRSLNFEVDLGFLKAQVVNGSFGLNSSVRLNLLNPDDDVAGNITLAELQGTSISNLLDVEVKGSLDVALPLQVSLAGLNLAGNPVIRITSSDLFDLNALTVKSENVDDLFNFSNVSAANVVFMMRQLATSLGSLGDSSAFAVPIPLTGKTLGDVLDFAATATRKLTDPLVVPGTDNPNFSTADELADRFAVALGLDPSVVNANYDSVTDELTFHLSFQESYNPGTAAVDLGLDLSPLGEFNFSTDFTLNASAGADFIFGIYLGDLDAGQSMPHRFFIQDATLAGSIRLAGNNMTAQAKIGMLGVGINNGSASLEASATVELQNPLAAGGAASLAPGASAGPAMPGPNRLPLPSFASLLLNDPASLIAPRRLDNLMPGVPVNISQQPGNQVEPVIVIDPSNPNRMFAASNGYRGGTMVASFSTDGGATWTSRLIGTGSAGDGFEPSGADPAAVFDKFGNLYFSYLSADHQKVPVLMSTDGGQTFLSQPIHTFLTNGATVTPPLQDIGLDRPVLAAGPTGDPASNDTAVWLAFIDRGIGIQVTGFRVTGAGRPNVGAFGPVALLTGTSQDNFPDITVGPKGQVAVVMQSANAAAPTDPSTINVFVDPDGLGAGNFGTKQLVAITQLGPKEPIAAQPERKINSAPSIGYAMTGPHVGELYVVYTEQSSAQNNENETDIVLRYSQQDGAAGSWTPTVTRVSHGPAGSSQFWPIMAIDPKTGNIAVAWYDTRHDPTNKKKVDFYTSVSTDGGRSFGVETRLTTASSEEDRAQNLQPPAVPADPFDDLTDTDFGDYTAIDFFDGDFFPTWADNSIDTPNAVDRFDIHTVKVSLGKSAPASPFAAGLGALAAATSSSGIAFTGYAHADLPIQLQPALIPLPGAKFVIDWSDLTDLTSLSVEPVNITSSIESLLDSFQNLTFDNILSALQNVVGYLKNLQGFGFLNQKLPLIDVSVSGLLDYAQKFADKIEELRANPAGSIQELQTLLDDTFGVPVTIMLDPSNNLKFQLDFASSLATTRNLNFDLASLPGISSVPGLADIVNISGAAGLNVTIDTMLNLALGIDLSDPLSPSPFLYDGEVSLGGTGFSLDARLNAFVNDLTVSIGIISAKVTNGTASVHHKDFNNQPAHFGILITDDDNNGRHYFSEDLIEDVTVKLEGAAEIELPLSISFPTPQNLTPNFKVTIPDLAAMFRGEANSVQFQTPDLSTLIGDLDLFSNMSGLVEGLDQLLALLQTALDNKAFSRNLPLVGNHLKDGAQVIKTFREEIIAKIKPLVDADASAQGVRQALFAVLGPGDMNLLKDRIDDTDDVVTIDDIEMVMDDPTSPNDVRFNFHLHKPKTTQTPGGGLNFDLGLPAIQLQVAGSVDVEMGFDFAVGVGLNRQDGVYFDTSGLNELMIDFGVNVRNFAAVGNLSFLQMNVTDNAQNPSKFTGTFKVDLLDSNTDTDTRLTIGELTDAGISAHLVADADINLGLKVSFDGAAAFPSISSDLNIDWHFDSDTTAATFGNAPQVAFENIKLDLGSFFSGYASSVLGTIRQVLDPLQPIIDFLSSRVDMLEEISAVRDYFDQNDDEKVTVLEIIHALADNPRLGFIDAVVTFSGLVQSIPGSSNVQIDLGRFDLNDQPDLRTLSSLEGLTPSAGHTHEANVDAQLDSAASDFSNALDEMKDVATMHGGSFSFPLIQSPSKVFKLLLGQDVDLFRWELPEFQARLVFDDITIPIFGGIVNLGFGGSIEVHAQAGFAYDTFGLREWRKTGHSSDISKGFYLIDKPEGSSEDPPEIFALGEIHASAGLDAIVISGNVTGSLIGSLALDLVDPNNDGKVRLDELLQNLSMGPLCIFKIDGSLDAQLSGSITIGRWPLDKTFTAKSPLIHLLSFDHECEVDGVPTDPGLAQDLGSGVLLLNVGPDWASHRKISNKTDGDEAYTIGPDPDVPGNVLVSAFGFTQSFAGITSIVADAGAGNDSILIDPSLDVTAVLRGGAGNDVLQAGAGQATLTGDEGGDQLFGGASNDRIFGLDGDDLIFGGDGNDVLNGGDDIDVIYGEGGNDTITGGAGIGYFLGGDGNDSITGGPDDDTFDGGAGNDTLIGSAGNDQFHGYDGDDSIVGGDGNDSLAGDAGNDTLDGGNGPDLLYGGDGDDSISGGDANDTAFGEAGNDSISGGALQDQLHGGDGNDTIAGEGDNDDVFGDAGNDSLDGGADNDHIIGGEGNDTITGQAGFDLISGSAGNDSIDGGADNDRLSGDEGDDTITGGTGNDSIEGGTGNDSLSGNEGVDTIYGQEGDDKLFGGDDSDRLFGDAGNDTIAGETAADYIEGGADADVITGDAGADRIFGNAGDDSIHGNADNDTIGGGAGNDILFGDAGADSQAGDDGADLIFGDFGQATVVGGVIMSFQSTSIGATDGGGNDWIDAGNGHDTALGGQGSDTIRGGAGDDDLIGGHNVAGGADAADTLDGGAGSDAIAGDNASIVRLSTAVSGRFRVVAASTLYSAAGTPAVTGDSQADPTGTPARMITLLDHSATTADGLFGADSIAGGAGNDCLFGGLGNDTIQGDASVDVVVSSTVPSVSSGDDGDDYIEGNGGTDLIFGNGGQDDIVGGSSDLFGLTSATMRPDAGDYLFGGSGTQTARNHLGDTSAAGHAADADFILGDNGNIFRIVGINGVPGAGFVTFNYDNYGAVKIIPRVVSFLDYTPGTGAPADVGGDDTAHGEAGDDSVYGQGGNDVLFGEGQDDNLLGGAAHDRIYGGTGEDGMLGDDGLILTSRNGLTEPLYGLTAPNLQAQLTLASGVTSVWTFITGRLFKSVDLTAFTSGGNDLMYGGVGDDFMHGGAGDDGMSGAEAQAQWYNDMPVGASFFQGLFTVADPTNPLGYNPATTTFAAYDNSGKNTAMKKIEGFFLNFDAVDGDGAKILDGKDRLFGDNGNDWLVGGTQNDRTFGGAGDDVLNQDDNLDTNGGLNNLPDDPLFADADFAFGGGGRDVLIANTGADRMYDWNGEYNSFYVPFGPFDTPTIIRRRSPNLAAFLEALGQESGADPTLTEPNGELGLTTSGENGGPRDPQPGNVGGVKRDTEGGPEDDRGTALPLS